MKKLLFCAALMIAATNVMAQDAASKARAGVYDRTTAPQYFFLEEKDVPSSVYLLPPPPEPGSAKFAVDEGRFNWGRYQRLCPRGQQAIADADVTPKGVAVAFSEAFGIELSEENTPEIYKLMTNMNGDAGVLSGGEAKVYYQRMRPFVYFGIGTSVPEDEAALVNNGSYPSGHTAIGWATALVLAEINVDHQNEILKRGYEMGESRVIAGYHYQSDVDNGRIVAAGVVARLHADEGFQKQLEKAKKEFAKLKKEGKIAPSTFSFTPDTNTMKY